MHSNLPMPRGTRARRTAVAAALLPLLAACTDRNPALPEVPAAPEPMAAAECTVSVPEASMVCTDARRPAGSSAVRGDKILGGQEVYVRLTSSNNSYDGTNERLTTYVTLQNLLGKTMGIDSTSAVLGVNVFFAQEPTVLSSGGGEVTLANADTSAFTAGNQLYFHYAQSLTPYQVSDAKEWIFNVPQTVTRFVFTIYVSAPLANYSGSLLDRVWKGTADGAWSNGANWKDGAAPDSGSTVAIPADSLITGVHTGPTLDTDGALSHLRVGYGSSLAMNGHTLTAWGNVDAVGALTGGTLRMRGGGALLGGKVSGVQVSGGVQLQKATTASGSVSVQDGALSVKDQTLTISVP